MHLCSKCAINARVAVPGHVFDAVSDGRTDRSPADMEEAVHGMEVPVRVEPPKRTAETTNFAVPCRRKSATLTL
jgi:hypothetical protein